MIDYPKSKLKLIEHCKKAFPEFAEKDEFEAAITHWLLCPEQIPPEMPKDVFFQLKGYWDVKSGKNRKKKIPNEKEKPHQSSFKLKNIPFPPPENPSFTFIDLFAGIGGFRIALQNLGGKCLFSSEWDKSAKKTYEKNFGEVPYGDINQFTNENITDKELDAIIPSHNILTAGFPCQPFSRAGVSARESLGQKHGFSCDIQGTLFFDVVRIANALKPDALILENVQNLKRHDNGNTFQKIKDTITKDLNYSFADVIIDSSSIVPQRRKRCFMVCFKDPDTKFTFPSFKGTPLPLHSILETNPLLKYTISDRLWEGHQKRTQRNLDRGAGFTAFEANLNEPSKTIVARYGKDGKECLIPQEGKNPRKLTPRECARLMGFPEDFCLPDADTPAYRQFGNSIVVPVVQRIAQAVIEELERRKS